MKCTFLGHRDAPQGIKSALERLLTDLIENKNISTFYVGNHGEFDSMALSILKQLSSVYTHINYFVVLAYMPSEKRRNNISEPTILPDGIECVPPRLAILKRNEWMINNSDCVVAYVKRSGGNSARFVDAALKKGKVVYNLAERQD